MSFIVDLHIHTATTSRCGRVEPEEIVKMYRNAGYDGIVITDHFYKDYFEKLGNISWKEKIDCFLAGYRKSKGAAKDLKVFLGLEFRNMETDDDFLVIGITEEFLYRNEDIYKLSLEEAISLFHSQGAIVIQAHPVRMRLAMLEGDKVRKNYTTEEMVKLLKENPNAKRMGFKEGIDKIKKGETEAFREPVFLRVCDLRCPEQIDGIEVYNGNYHWMQDEVEMKAITDHYPNLIQVSSSDFHEPGHCARGGTVLENKVETSEELVKQLKEGRIIQLIG